MEDFIREYTDMLYNPPKTRFQEYDFISNDEHIKLGLTYSPSCRVRTGQPRLIGKINFYRRQRGHDVYLKISKDIKQQFYHEDLLSIYKLSIWTAIKDYNLKLGPLYIYLIQRFRWAFCKQLKKELVNMDYIHATLPYLILTLPPYDYYIDYNKLSFWEKYIVYSYVIQQKSMDEISINTSLSKAQIFKEVKLVTEE